MTEDFFISSTQTYFNRLKELRDGDVLAKNFKPTKIDIPKSFGSFQNNNEVVRDEEQDSCERLLTQPKYVQRQITDLKKKGKEFALANLEPRYLVRLPSGMPKLNEVRDVISDIQIEAGVNKTIFVPVSASDTYEYVDKYLENRDKNEDIVLVVDMALENEDLQRIINKYATVHDEVVLLYRNWNEYRTNHSFVLAKALEMPSKFHMAFVPIDFNDYGDGEIFSTLLMCYGFKSVSLIDTPFKGFIKPKKNSAPKSFSEKMNFSKWIDERDMTYVKTHRQECSCCEDKDVRTLSKKFGINKVITHHNLEVLSQEYSKIKKSREHRNKVLKLDSLMALSNSLKLQ